MKTIVADLFPAPLADRQRVACRTPGFVCSASLGLAAVVAFFIEGFSVSRRRGLGGLTYSPLRHFAQSGFQFVFGLEPVTQLGSRSIAARLEDFVSAPLDLLVGRLWWLGFRDGGHPVRFRWGTGLRWHAPVSTFHNRLSFSVAVFIRGMVLETCVELSE
jgi:hypothetical protein